jgi:single-strand DNA-binding protein
MNFNKVIVSGNLTRDPESKSFSDSSVCRFTIAVNEKRGDKEEVLFLDCNAWGKTGELIQQNFKKGENIFVEGRLRLEKWEKDGQNHSKISMTVDRMVFIGGGKKNDDYPNRAAPRTRSSRPEPKREPVTEDDIPF